ncbi:MAG: glycoside hydrolase family 92 protein [Lentisphaeria bacterium]|nr:glycoside hydrolase family 92 protein [Lentisphaeria bacterium]
MKRLIHLVNLKQGTDSTFYFSTGNTLPLTAVPFGMNHWSIQTDTDDPCRFFNPRSRSFRGLRLTHQPSPWIRDYASLLLFPQTGELLTGKGLTAYFEPDEQELCPHRLRLRLRRDHSELRFAPTSRCGVLEIDFPAGAAKRLVIVPGTGERELEAGHGFRLRDGGAEGFVTNHSGGVTADFKFHYVMNFDCPPSGMTEQEGAYAVEFPPGTTRLTVRIGSSFISAEQARHSLEREVGSAEYAGIAARGGELWDRELNRIEIPDAPERERRIFYSCLYRTLLFPREFHEIDAAGNMVHYSPFGGGVHPGPLYTDNGFWDTHRTLYPLFSLLFPARLAEMLEGFLNAAREGGWFPRWCSPGYRSCMTGTHADAVFADAVMKELPGFDWREAYRFMLKDATEPGDAGGLYGRGALREYAQFGFVPDDLHAHSASQTMDYAAHDAMIALVAEKLGDPAGSALLKRRSGCYRNLFNPATGALQARRSDGTFTPFDPVEWSRAYIEGSSWQCGFAVPHDPEGFMALLGGREAMVARLDEMLAAPPDYRVGAYGCEIHEMVEMAAADFGQYAQSNQPVHHVLWFYTLAGRRELAARHVHRVARELYTPDAFPGDEDNGEMAAWYIWAAAGFYPFCPGKPEFVAHAPMFPRLVFHLENGETLTVRPAGKGGPHLNGRPCRAEALPYAELARGGVLEL